MGARAAAAAVEMTRHDIMSAPPSTAKSDRVAMGVFTLAAALLAGAAYDSWAAGHTEPEVNSKPSSSSKQNTEDDSKPKNLEARKHNATSSPLDPIVTSSSMDTRLSSPLLTLDVRAHTVTHTAHESQGGGVITTDY